MTFQPGQSGNPSGYKASTRRKGNAEVFYEIKNRGYLDPLITLAKIQHESENESVRANAAAALAPYTHPKLQSLPVPRGVQFVPMVRKAHMRGKAIGSQAMAKPPNKRPGEVSVRGPTAADRPQVRARHGSGCPVLGTLVPFGIHRTCRIVAGLAACSASLPRKSKHGHTWPPPRARVARSFSI
jgi:hypothetical protein